MTDNDWKWYSGSNDEEFHNGPFDTREEAVDALDGYGGFVIEARKDDLRLSSYFHAETLLEGAEEDAYDLSDEGDLIFDISDDQECDLQARVRAAIDTWQDAHGLRFVPFLFTASRNEERIEENAA